MSNVDPPQFPEPAFSISYGAFPHGLPLAHSTAWPLLPTSSSIGGVRRLSTISVRGHNHVRGYHYGSFAWRDGRRPLAWHIPPPLHASPISWMASEKTSRVACRSCRLPAASGEAPPVFFQVPDPSLIRTSGSPGEGSETSHFRPDRSIRPSGWLRAIPLSHQRNSMCPHPFAPIPPRHDPIVL